MDLYNLTPQQKIKILENIDWEDMIAKDCGLCYGITESIYLSYTNMPYYLITKNLSNIIDLFTFENSRKFSSYEYADKLAYWFKYTEQGYFERKNFVNWMVNEYKKQL